MPRILPSGINRPVNTTSYGSVMSSIAHSAAAAAIGGGGGLPSARSAAQSTSVGAQAERTGQQGARGGASSTSGNPSTGGGTGGTGVLGPRPFTGPGGNLTGSYD
jgi:hypothetical protein